MSYSIDVYRRRLEPVKSLLDYATYIAFFPQLVAGPIVRALSFLPQLSELRVWRSVDVRAALTLFFIGFVKKACLSENVAPVVDAYFADPGRFDVASAFIAVFFYATQIYCDFSGYSDMAIACAALLGYQLTINFNYPYLAANITEFWRRWHISLSTWLRDYLYIPLGGNRGSKLFTYRNLMLTMLIGGLWHGAAWTFVVWGGMHGLALIVHREYDRIASGAGAVWQKIRSYAGPVVCFYFVCITWVLFRAQPIVDRATGEVKTGGFEAAMMILKSFILLQPNGGRQVVAEMGWCFVAFGLLAAIHAMASRKMFATWWRRLPDWGYAAALGAGVSLALFFVPQKFKAFIYFQF
jgi:alginate O-acetyltransferase complex protein AlgI